MTISKYTTNRTVVVSQEATMNGAAEAPPVEQSTEIKNENQKPDVMNGHPSIGQNEKHAEENPKEENMWEAESDCDRDHHWLAPDRATLTVEYNDKNKLIMPAWELIVLAQYWAQAFKLYSGYTFQTYDKWDMEFLSLSMNRSAQIQREMATHLSKICDEVEKNERYEIEGLKSLLIEMSYVWNLAPIAGLRWNENGWVPKSSFATVVERAANIVDPSTSRKERQAKFHTWWKARHGLEFYDDYLEHG